ncbi:MAG: hypothetical protein ACLFR8_11595 [Alkalispirochaeta sp.]
MRQQAATENRPRREVEAVRCAEAETFDLVLKDIQIPEIDGLEALRVAPRG